MSKSVESSTLLDNGSIAFIVEGDEIVASRGALMKKSEYFCNLVSKVDQEQEIRVLLPKWTTSNAFRLLLNFVQDQPMGSVEIKDSQRLLWLSDFFRIHELTQFCIKDLIITRLNKDNVLMFMEDSQAKLSSTENAASIWQELYLHCLNVTAQNIHYIIKFHYKQLHRIDPATLEEIVEKSFKMFNMALTTDHGPLIDLLSKLRKVDSIFELLEDENRRVVEKETEDFTKMDAKPTLTWKLTNLRGNFFKESEPVPFMNSYWVLSVWSLQKEESVSIAISQSKSPKEIEEQLNESYYKKNQFFVSSKKKGAHSKDESEELKSAAVLDGRIPNHCILTLGSFIRIEELEDGGGVLQLNSLISASKTPTVIRKLKLQELNSVDNKLTMQIFLKLEYNYSAILSYISKNFNWLYNDPAIAHLAKNQLQVLFRHKYLNIRKEDEAITALCLWIRTHQLQDIKDLLENINWSFISLNCLIDIVKNVHILRLNPFFQEHFRKEIKRRYENKYSNEAPRYSYKYLEKEETHHSFIHYLIQTLIEPKDEISDLMTNLEKKTDEEKDSKLHE